MSYGYRNEEEIEEEKWALRQNVMRLRKSPNRLKKLKKNIDFSDMFQVEEWLLKNKVFISKGEDMDIDYARKVSEKHALIAKAIANKLAFLDPSTGIFTPNVTFF